MSGYDSVNRDVLSRVTQWLIDVIVTTRRHVGGILNVNKNRVNMRKYENSSAKVTRGPSFSTGV